MKSTQLGLLMAITVITFNHITAQNSTPQYAVSYTYDNAGNRICRQVVLLSSKVKQNQQDIQPTEDQMGERTIKIFPNPTRGNLNIDVTNLNPKEELRIELYNINGTQLYNARVQEGSNPLDMNTYPCTVYILRLVSGSEKMEYKIIKE